MVLALRTLSSVDGGCHLYRPLASTHAVIRRGLYPRNTSLQSTNTFVIPREGAMLARACTLGYPTRVTALGGAYARPIFSKGRS